MVLILLALSLFYAWRYSKIEADPDWAMFNFEAFGVGLYGRDYADCKSPAVHLFYWMIAKVVGKDVGRVRFAYHVAVSGLGIGAYLLNGDFIGSLAYVVLVNSGWMLAFHGNVGAVPAGLLFLGLAAAANPWLAFICFALAVVYEPKLAPAALALVAVYGLWLQFLAGLLVALPVVLYLELFNRTVWDYMVEANWTIPKRMNKPRRYPWAPVFTSTTLLYLMPWLALAALAKPDFLYWLPALAFALVTGMGRVIRPNHLLPLAGWIAAAGIDPVLVLALAGADWVSGGLYLGDIWARFYPGLAERVRQAREAGEWLRGKPGMVWVNSLHSEVYIYAEKEAPYGMVEQIEIREASPERRAHMRDAFQCRPPDWVVTGPDPGVNFTPRGYAEAARNQMFQVWRKL
jgi:hypothetical protein